MLNVPVTAVVDSSFPMRDQRSWWTYADMYMLELAAAMLRWAGSPVARANSDGRVAIVIAADSDGAGRISDLWQSIAEAQVVVAYLSEHAVPRLALVVFDDFTTERDSRHVGRFADAGLARFHVLDGQSRMSAMRWFVASELRRPLAIDGDPRGQRSSNADRRDQGVEVLAAPPAVASPSTGLADDGRALNWLSQRLRPRGRRMRTGSISPVIGRRARQRDARPWTAKAAPSRAKLTTCRGRRGSSTAAGHARLGVALAAVTSRRGGPTRRR